MEKDDREFSTSTKRRGAARLRYSANPFQNSRTASYPVGKGPNPSEGGLGFKVWGGLRSRKEKSKKKPPRKGQDPRQNSTSIGDTEKER